MTKLDKLIGIPFKIGREDFEACDCVGICWLYYKYICNKDFPHRDGKRLKFRNTRHDLKRILSVLTTWASPIGFDDLRKNDIIMVNEPKHKVCALGVCVDNFQILIMAEKIGSILVKKKYLKKVFIKGYRPNEM